MVSQENQEYVILVDKTDQPLGYAEKIWVHQQGLCHRAFSVFVFNAAGELLLQQRKKDKYHCGGLWTNTCCSHPRQGESIVEAAERRLQEEMGISLPLKSVGAFHYVAHFDNGLTENEYDHVLIGRWHEGLCLEINSTEIQDYRWLAITPLERDLALYPEKYTPWLKPALQLALKGK